MTTLITGGGQIGAHAAQILIAEGRTPVVYDVNPPLEFIRTVVTDSALQVERGDIRDLASLIDVIRRHQVRSIIHTAAVLPPASEENPRLTTDVNVTGTSNVLEVARLTGVARVVFCSTLGLYDMAAARGATLHEDDSLKVDTVYASSKLYGEQLGRSYGKCHGIEFVTLRFAHIFGPAPLPIRPGIASFVGELASACLRGIDVAVKPRTTTAREYVYIMDAARAAVLAATAPTLADRVFNIGTGRVHEPAELVAIARGIAPGTRIDLEPFTPPAGAVAGRPFDLLRASRQLGYAPVFDVEAGVRHHMAYLQLRQ